MSNENKGWIAAVVILILAVLGFYVYNSSKTTSPTGTQEIMSTPAPTESPLSSPTPSPIATPDPTPTPTPIININVNP